MSGLKFAVKSIVISLVCLFSSIVSAETLRVGSTPTSAPFCFLDSKTNTIRGLMVDIVTEVAKEAGYDVEFSPIVFSALIPSLTSKKIDIIAAAMLATDARREVINFSEPVYRFGEGLFVPKKDTTNYVSLEDLKGAVIGSQVGSSYLSALQKTGFFSEIKSYDSIPDIIRDVDAGRIKAGFGDYPIVKYNLGQGDFANTRLVESYKPRLQGPIGIGLRKEDGSLGSKLNGAIEKLKADGRLDTIVKKWGL